VQSNKAILKEAIFRGPLPAELADLAAGNFFAHLRSPCFSNPFIRIRWSEPGGSSSVQSSRLVAGVVQCVLLLVGSRGVNAQSLPAPWVSADVGAPTLAGSASYASGVFTIEGAGTDIWGTSDQFRFVYQQVSGDVEIVARVRSITNQDEWSKAGVMIRATLAANSAHALALVSAAKGVKFQRRPSTGALSASTSASTASPPAWIKAVRTGNTVTTYWSTTGSSWTTMGSVSLPLGTSAYVGIAVTSHDPGARTTATVSDVTVTRKGLPQGQQSRDIGSPAIAGSATYTGGTYTIKAAGTDIWGAADQFHFVYQPMSGNAEIIARVASLTNTDVWAKAGVMIRETLTAGSRHASMFISASKGYAFQRRPDAGVWSVHTSGGSGAPPGWVRLVRSGDRFDAYRSADGVSWTAVGSDTIPMADTVYVGLAVTSHNTSATTTSVITNVRISGTASSNAPPVVNLSSPTSGATFSAPATINLTATASDPENQLARVEFRSGTTVLATDTTAPFAWTWGNVAAGTYTLTARAYDSAGAVATSAAVTVTVGTTTTAPRLVSFTASADHATNVTSYLFEVFAGGANVLTAIPIVSSNLGKPTPDSTKTITVDRSTLFSALAVGNYVATVTAIGPGGRTRSSPVSFTR
jgi:regulation of enolase protein 1 (concanavalin A-like superfamily)